MPWHGILCLQVQQAYLDSLPLFTEVLLSWRSSQKGLFLGLGALLCCSNRYRDWQLQLLLHPSTHFDCSCRCHVLRMLASWLSPARMCSLGSPLLPPLCRHPRRRRHAATAPPPTLDCRPLSLLQCPWRWCL